MTTSRSLRPYRSFRAWRRLAEVAQAVLLLGHPFLRVGGESALRFDVPTLRLHFFGASLAMDEGFVVLAATLLLTALFLLATLVLGRAWCGWACPQTVLSDLTGPLDRWRRRGGARALAAHLGLAAAGAVVSAGLVWWFVEPRAFLRGLAGGTLHPVALGAWLAMAAVIWADLAFLRARFCATACPYAKVQGVLFDRATLVVAYDASREADCIDCGACVRCCPTGIDIRHGLQVECIACAECIDACAPIMARLKRKPDLVGYFFGEPGGRARLSRPAALALAGVTLAAAALLLGTAAARSALDLQAQPAADFAPRRTADGQVVNAYQLSLENRGRAPVALRLSLSVPGLRPHLRPDEVRLAPGERRSLRVLALAGEADLPPGRVAAELRVETEGGPAATRQLTFVVAEKR